MVEAATSGWQLSLTTAKLCERAVRKYNATHVCRPYFCSLTLLYIHLFACWPSYLKLAEQRHTRHNISKGVCVCDQLFISLLQSKAKQSKLKQVTLLPQTASASLLCVIQKRVHWINVALMTDIRCGIRVKYDTFMYPHENENEVKYMSYKFGELYQDKILA